MEPYIRDERVWLRALNQAPSPEAKAATSNTREGSWPLFRRGSNDNASATRFANSLRFPTPAVSMSSDSAISVLSKQRWNFSTRCSPPDVSTDPLWRLLEQNIARRSVAKEGSQVATLLPRRRSASTVRTERKSAVLLQRLGELLEEEKAQRLELFMHFKIRFGVWRQRLLKGCLKLLQEEERVNRKCISHSWEEWARDISETQESAIYNCTNMTATSFQKLCLLLTKESAARKRTSVEEANCRSLIDQMGCLEHLRLVRRELELCRRQELQLSRKKREVEAQLT